MRHGFDHYWPAEDDFEQMAFGGDGSRGGSQGRIAFGGDNQSFVPFDSDGITFNFYTPDVAVVGGVQRVG
jgi:hypothetical protein